MKLPALVFSFAVFLFAGFALLALQAFRPAPSAPPPSRVDAGDAGVVMGEDFTVLLSNPNLTLKVEKAGDTVYFAWTSESDARLEEAYQLGLHMQAAKAALEIRGRPLDGVEEGARTAAAAR